MNLYQVELTLTANKDLEDIAYFIAVDSPKKVDRGVGWVTCFS